MLTEVLPTRGGAENSPRVYRALRDCEGAVEVGDEIVGNAVSEAVHGLAWNPGVDDGEAVALRDDGRSDFGALMTKRGGLMR